VLVNKLNQRKIMKKIGRLSGMAAFVFAGAITAWAYTTKAQSVDSFRPPLPRLAAR
jgi:hypothetical protein